MVPVQLNVATSGQFLTISNAETGLQGGSAFTVEATLTLGALGSSPTIVCRPVSTHWAHPFAAYRLGFTSGLPYPEFALLLEGTTDPVITRALQPISLHTLVHVAGTYDGANLRLYVDGNLASTLPAPGRILDSAMPPTVGARSSTDPGDYFVGVLHELRMWNVARSGSEIDKWKNRVLPLPAPPSCTGLWQFGPGLALEFAKTLLADGLTESERALVAQVCRYRAAYERACSAEQNEQIKNVYGDTILCALIICAADGYIVTTEPQPQSYIYLGSDNPGVYVLIMRERSVSSLLQQWTGNRLKIATRPSNEGIELSDDDIPQDLPQTNTDMVSLACRDLHCNMPAMVLVPAPDASVVATGIGRCGRVRVISPLVELPDGRSVRMYSWVVLDCFIGHLSDDIARMGRAEAVALGDVKLLENQRRLLIDVAAQANATEENFPTEGTISFLMWFSDVWPPPVPVALMTRRFGVANVQILADTRGCINVTLISRGRPQSGLRTQPITTEAEALVTMMVSWSMNTVHVAINGEQLCPFAETQEALVVESIDTYGRVKDGIFATDDPSAARRCSEWVEFRRQRFLTTDPSPKSGHRRRTLKEQRAQLQTSLNEIQLLTSRILTGDLGAIGHLATLLRALVYWNRKTTYRPLLLRLAARYDLPLPLYATRPIDWSGFPAPIQPVFVEGFEPPQMRRTSEAEFVVDLQDWLLYPLRQTGFDPRRSLKDKSTSVLSFIAAVANKSGTAHFDEETPEIVSDSEVTEIFGQSLTAHVVTGVGAAVQHLGEWLLERTEDG